MEILNSLTKEQKEEFEKDIEDIIILTGKEYNYNPDKIAEVNINLRLKNEIFFNVSLFFHCDEKGNVKREIKDIKKFNTVDEYLDAINDVKKTISVKNKKDSLRCKH